jgi:hypothetical protein
MTRRLGAGMIRTLHHTDHIFTDRFSASSHVTVSNAVATSAKNKV